MALNTKQVTLIGNVTADPEVKQTSNGTSVVNISIAVNDRKFNRETQEWEDGEPLYVRGTAWRELAENIGASLVKGSRVVVVGDLKPNSYEKDGVTVNTFELDIHEVGASLSRATAKLTKNTRTEAAAEEAEEPAAAKPAKKASKKPAVVDDEDDDEF